MKAVGADVLSLQQSLISLILSMFWTLNTGTSRRMTVISRAP